MSTLSQWADRIESRIQAAPEVVAVGPRPPRSRKLFGLGLVAAAAVLIWAAAPGLAPSASSSDLPPIPQASQPLAASLRDAVRMRGGADRFEIAPLTRAQLGLSAEASSKAPGAALAAATDVNEAAGPANVRIARQLLGEQGDLSRFMALAVTVESYASTPYWDAAGINVGMGYCITRRVKEEGAERVRQDLTAAGLSAADVTTLMGHDRRAQKKVVIEEDKAVALLRQVAPDYQARARAFVGETTFDSLPDNRKAALTWLAYNTGPNIEQFDRLRKAVQTDRPEQALGHLTPTYRDASGSLVPNHRAGAYLAAAYWSENGLRTAVANSDRFESMASTTADPVRLSRAAEKVALPPQVARTLGQAALVHASPTVPAPPSVVPGVTPRRLHQP